MATKDIVNKMKRLAEELNEASDVYYNQGGQIMSNFEWDQKFNELQRLEEEAGEILPDSPTHTVGHTTNTMNGQKEKHEHPALSLDKTKSIKDLVKWADGRPIWLSWKLDGSTAVITYDNGNLTKIVTRGNGIEGVNITHLASAIQGVPKQIEYKKHLVVRGECLISYSSFKSYVNNTGSDAANPRNLAAGSLNVKSVNDIVDRGLTFRPFTLVAMDKADQVEHLTHWGSQMFFLKEWGFNPVEHECILIPTEENLEQIINSDKWNPENYDYPVDGLVICYDDTIYASGGSVTGHHATRSGYAFKWQDEEAETVLDHIEWSCATTAITPVAVFEPVELEGTTVTRASLHNVSECYRLGIGAKGTKLSVIKSNKIIPQVIRANPVGVLHVPETCPVCGGRTELIITNNRKAPVQILTCTNPQCAGKHLKKFARFVSKDGMNIDGLSEAKIKDLINGDFIKNISDIYRLENNHKGLDSRPGWGRKSVNNLLNSIEKSKSVDGEHFLYSLSIPMCGHDVCKKLMAEGELRDILRMLIFAAKEGDFDKLTYIEGIGSEKSEAVIKWFSDPLNVVTVKELFMFVNIIKTEKTKGTSCKDLKFVVTGKVEHFKNRNELKKFIEDRGGKVIGSVSKATDYLINNDIESNSSKNNKAKSLGVEIITEQQFVEMFS